MTHARPIPTLIALATLAAPCLADDPGLYLREVKPILARHCIDCHGAEQSRGRLRLDTAGAIAAGGVSGPAVVAGEPDESELLLAILGEGATDRMPLNRPPLSDSEIASLRSWIAAGAEVPEAEGPSVAERPWSLDPPERVAPPVVRDESWASNPIDRFILGGLERAGLMPSPEADRLTLIRRASFDLIGLPPSPEEVDAFLADDRPDAFDRLVDRLLASPRHGERWAQHWLDVIRWAETWGFETNSARPDAWQYRDWVIGAINDDLPYDRFVFEQIAGDTVGSDAATGLLVAGPANLPGQVGKDEESIRQARQDELDEVVKTVSAAFLGLTVGCARCHDHKFDPISQRDYTAMQATFAGLRYGHRRDQGPEADRWAAEAEQIKRTLESLRHGLDAERASLGLREPVAPGHHTDRFEPVDALSIRMNIRATHSGGRPSLFEFEAWTTTEGDAVNVASAEHGGAASASSFALENQSRHPDNLIDGTLDAGDGFPWIAKEAGPAWIRVDLAEPATIDRVSWRQGWDGFPVDYVVEVLGADDRWVSVAHTRDRMLHQEDRRAAADIALDGVSAETIADLVARLAEARGLDAEGRRLAEGPQIFAGSFGEPEPTHLLHRGDPMQPLDEVAPDVPAVLGSLGLDTSADEAGRRVALARHLAEPGHPLAARVMVNRIWQQHFGVGLVATPSDFGRMGEAPSHPELLDWLAVEFIDRGWSMKSIHRLILSSRTYRQASTPRDDAIAVDADARLLWRFPPRRLEAEAIRDAILRASGTLNSAMSGPGFDFFNQKGGLSDYIPREEFDADGLRRMIYATKIRMQAVDVFGSFDCPDAGQMTPRRTQSITPIQALDLWNSRFVNDQAARFADRVRAEAGPGSDDQVGRAVRIAFGRTPTGDEAGRLGALHDAHGLDQVCRVLLNANEFLFVP